MTVVILVGTETGNSLDYATRASQDLERQGIENEIYLMDEYRLEELLDVSVVIFVCSTTGDGEEPANMRRFMKFLLRADLPKNLFNGIGFAVFGLGDSSYDKFNYVGKRVYRRMQQLGGRDLVGYRGEGDERSSKGIEGGWSVWWEALADTMKEECSDGLRGVYGELEPLPPRCSLILSPTLQKDQSVTKAFPASLESCERLTPLDHFQDTRLLKFKIEIPEDSAYSFQPGDILNLKPSNDPGIVNELMDLMGWKGDEVNVYGIEGKFVRNWDQGFPREFPMTLSEFLRHWVDLLRIPSKSTLKTLACLCDTEAAEYSPMHRDKLIELSRDEGEYLDYVWRPKRSIVEILKDFQPTVRISLDRLLQVFVPIKCRQFSIANDVTDGRVELLVALVREELPMGRGNRDGLCSQWINSQNIMRELRYVTISHGSLNHSILKPVILLFASGTGIAPLRSIIQRYANTSKTIYLYFGCRSKQKDFYFLEDWQRIKNLTVFVKGSRDEGGRRCYLDDVIKSGVEPVLNVNVDGISCLVAGHSRLNKLVQDTLNEIWKDRIHEGKSWIEYLKSKGQYQSETWS